MSDVSVVETHRLPTLWRNASFMLMWSSVAASGFGDRVIMLSAEHLLGINAAGATASTIAAGVAFFFFLPYLLLTIVGGWLADRLPRKWIMLACDESRAVVLLIAWFMAADYVATTENFKIPDAHGWKVFVIIALTGAFAALFNPSKFALMPQLVRTNDLQPANAVLAGIALIASLIGYTMGGYVKTSLQPAIMIGVLCYAISGTFFAFLKPTHAAPSEKKEGRGFLATTIKYLATHSAVRNLVILNILFWGASWVVASAMAALAKGYYGIPNEEFFAKKNYMMVAIGAGALSSSLVVMWIRSRRVSGVIALSSLFIAGCCMLALALNRVYIIGVILAFGSGFFGGVFLIGVDTLTQSITPDYIRGRVFGLRSMLNTCATVGVNFCIWRMPPETADAMVLWVLGVTASVLSSVSAYGVWRTVTRGPIPTRFGNLLWHITRLYTMVWHQLVWVRRDRVPSKGRVILASNHTTGIDGLLIQAAMPRLVTWVMEPRCSILFFLWRHIDPVVIHPDRGGLTAMREAIRALKSDDRVIGFFPEGRLQRDQRKLHKFEAGVGLLARKSDAAIVPVWISGTPRAQGMLWHFIRPSRAILAFGQPWTPDRSLSNEQIAEQLRQRIFDVARETGVAMESCRECKYDLRGTHDAAIDECPECGAIVFLPPGSRSN